MATELKLRIKLGNDAMQSWGDLGKALQQVANTLAVGGTTKPALGGSGPILDVNFNRVGKWEVK